MRRLLGLEGLLLGGFLLGFGWAPSLRADDGELLRKAGLGTDEASLVRFFRRGLMSSDYRRLVDALPHLASQDAKEREKAKETFLGVGLRAVSTMRSALERVPEKGKADPLREVRDTLKQIEGLRGTLDRKSPEPGEVVLAAARTLLPHKSADGFDAVLDFLPVAPDETTEEELLALLAQYGAQRLRAFDLRQGPPARRAAVAYAIGRFLGPQHRPSLLDLMDDPAPGVRQRVLDGLAGKAITRGLSESRTTDLQTLQAHKIAGDEASLLAFFKGRVRSPADLERIRIWIRELGHSDFRVRDRATTALVQQGPAALPFLQDAAATDDPEVQRRVYLCRQSIRNGPGPELPIAAARLLALGDRPGESLATLLEYLPFADSESVAEEIHHVLTVLAVRSHGRVGELQRALRDEQPARRGAAAVVLGRTADSGPIESLRDVLKDANPLVRVRAAQGLFAAQAEGAVAAVIDQIPTCPPGQLGSLEETLLALAGETAPVTSLTDTSDANRTRAQLAWKEWWQRHRAVTDPIALRRGEAYQGLITICEYDSGGGGVGGRGTGKVWQRSRDGTTRWSQEGFLGAMHAQALPGGRVLVAENVGNRVVERDAFGKVVWEFSTPGNPIACQRLPNGNTFIATYNQVMEVSADKKVVYSHNRGPAFYLFSAERTRDGRIVCMTAQGILIELDATDGREIRQFRAVQGGGWCSAQALPSGRYLVASMATNGGQVREIDAQGKTYWEASFPGAFRALKLPSGNVLAVSMSTKKVAELDREGRTRWEVTCQGRPWSVQYK